MSSAALPQLELWFEFASTYSYLTVCRVEDLAASQDVEIVWRPFLLGPIFKSVGWSTSPFNLQQAKGRYMWRDIERQCAACGLPFRRPTRFPQHSVLAARVAILAADGGWCPAFARQVMLANFAEDRDISDPATISTIIGRLGHDGAETLAQAGTTATKDRLRRQTDRASALGIFGAPTMIAADGEMFWGNDRLEQALAWARKAQ